MSKFPCRNYNISKRLAGCQLSDEKSLQDNKKKKDIKELIKPALKTKIFSISIVLPSIK
jgi:hypothetical protein